MKSVFLILFLGVSVAVFSQQNFDKRLLTKFSEEQILELQHKNPNIVGYMEYYLNHGYSIVSKSNLTGQLNKGTVKLKSLKPAKINLFALSVSLPLNADVYYGIEGEDEVLVLHSRKTMLSDFQNELKK